MKKFVNVYFCVCLFSQRFKGTEVDVVTEDVKAVKIDDTPKEVKTEAVEEEVPPYNNHGLMFLWFLMFSVTQH